MTRLALIPTLALGFLLLTAQQPALEESPELRLQRSPGITTLEVTVAGEALHVTLHLEGAFGPELLERIESGLPTGFVYRLQLLRDRKRWWDHRLVETRVEVLAMFNAVTREYLVNTKQNGKLVESRVARNIMELEAELTRVDELPAFQLSGVDPGTRVLVRAQAELGHRTVFSFIPTSVRTGWAESTKLRTPSR